MTIAEEDTKRKETHFRSLVFGMLDLSAAMFFFLPLFGQKVNTAIQAVSLSSLVAISSWLRTAYFVVVIGMIGMGILTLALQNCNRVCWMKNKSKLSLAVSTIGTLLFMISSQPYAAAFVFLFLIIKVLMLIKWQ